MGIGRGLGVSGIARALRMGGKPRTGVELGYHVLDAMLAFEDSSREGMAFRVESVCGTIVDRLYVTLG